jgi:mono/diheme cytochrome c family protein
VAVALGGVVPWLVSAQLPAPSTDPVTFAKDIAPILQRSCQQCHRPDSVAPMSLITYAEVRPWARAIRQRTALGRARGAMPPWFIEKNIGIQQFKDDISLSDEELARIARWVDSGAPPGDTAAMPPVTLAEMGKWQIGKPDLLLTSPTVEMKAVAADWWGPIGEIPTGLTEDRYVAAVEYREVSESRGDGRQTVGGRFIIHHASTSVIDPDLPQGSVAQRSQSFGPPHEVGRNADIFDPEAGKLLRAGSKISLHSVHLHSNGRSTRARLEIALKFHPRGYRPKKRIDGFFVGTADIDIKGLEANQQIHAYYTLPEHTKILTFEPHMHASGVRQCVEAIWGTRVETLNCTGYDHSWVKVYTYPDDAAPLLPKGTILHVTGYFDTTPANKNVADPRNWQGLGHRSMDNMMSYVGQGVQLTDEEFQKAVVERREKLRLTEGASVPGCPLCGYSRLSIKTAGN